MSWATIDGRSVISTRLTLPRSGVWLADVAVDAQTAAGFQDGAAATLQLAGGAMSFSGTVFRGGDFVESVTLRMVGGSGGLSKPSSPQFFQGTDIMEPLEALLEDAGESLSPKSDPSVTGFGLSFWVTITQAVANGLTNLMNAGPTGSVWRVMPDGSIFVGIDGFAPSAMTEYELEDFQPQEGLYLVGADVPNVYPGESLDGRRVSCVEHRVSAKGNTAKVWFES